jgi:uncharacterized protein YmfQ (DUF2313 family)
MSASIYSASDFLQALQSLLPGGRVWPRDPDATQAKVLIGLVQVNARLNLRANQLLDESHPDTAVELLPEWESALGLPDPAIGQLPTLQGRRASATARFANSGGQSADYFIAQALLLGYTVTINNNAPFRAGQSRVGQPVGSVDWFFVFAINAPLNSESQFRAGQSSAGDPLNYWSNLLLGAELSELKPAHSILQFNYQ